MKTLKQLVEDATKGPGPPVIEQQLATAEKERVRYQKYYQHALTQLHEARATITALREALAGVLPYAASWLQATSGEQYASEKDYAQAQRALTDAKPKGAP